MSENKSPTNDWRTILSLVLSGLGIVYFLIQSFSLGALWFTNYIDPQVEINQTISYGLLVWFSIFSLVMLLPVFLLSLSKVRDNPPPKWLDVDRRVYRKYISAAILLWPGLVFSGWLVSDRPTTAAFLLGAINILVAGLPILWIYTSASSRLDRGLKIRQWQIFGFSLTITPIIIIIVEVIALLFLAAAGFVYVSYQISLNPSLEQDLMVLINQVSLQQGNINAILEIIKPYVLQPGVIVWALVVFAGIIPVIEEMIKPIALWPLAGHNISPQEGFVGGLLCGAGFALIENIMYFTVSLTSTDWLFMAIGRAGTGVLHMLASGLFGWGLAAAWRERKWFFLATMSVISIILHGLWNAVALASGVASIISTDSEITIWDNMLYSLPGFFLLLASVATIILINHHFQGQNHSEPMMVDGDKPQEII